MLNHSCWFYPWRILIHLHLGMCPFVLTLCLMSWDVPHLWGIPNFTALKLIVFGMKALRFFKITNTADWTLQRMKLYQTRSPLKGALLLANKLVLCVVKIPLVAVAAAGFWGVDRGLIGRWSPGVALFLRGNLGMWEAMGNRPGSFVMT